MNIILAFLWGKTIKYATYEIWGKGKNELYIGYV